MEAHNDRIAEVVGDFWRSVLAQDKASLDQAAQGIFLAEFLTLISKDRNSCLCQCFITLTVQKIPLRPNQTYLCRTFCPEEAAWKSEFRVGVAGVHLSSGEHQRGRV